MKVVCRFLLAAGILIWVGGCAAPAATEESVDGAYAVTVWTDSTEVFAEYPTLVASSEPVSWLLHLTRRRDHAPITDAMVTLHVGNVRSETAAVAGPGIFRIDTALPAPGMYPAVLHVSGNAHEEEIALGPVSVYASQAEAEPADHADGGITLLKEAQWAVPFEVRQVRRGVIQQTIPVEGIVTEATSRVADVVAPVSGILVTGENLQTPTEGSHVAQGAVLATIVPLSSETSLASLRASVEQAEQELERVEKLHQIGAVPTVRLQDARREAMVARAAMQELHGAMGEDNRYLVRAPIEGFIETRAAIAGSVVDVGDQMFTIVDPRVVWTRLQLRVSEAEHVHQIRSLSFTAEGLDRRFFSDERIAVASVVDEVDRTIPVLFAVSNEEHLLAIGLYITGQVAVGGEESGVLLPNDAIQVEDGTMVAYVQTGGERFDRRVLTLGASDGQQSLVESGVQAGEYVVIQGTNTVYLASLNIGVGMTHEH